jgi:acyl dehydratase
MSHTPAVTTIAELEQLTGQELGVSPWFPITQERVNAFADATGDHQWIHVDVERAKAGPFGGTIVHGFLTLSLSLMLQENLEGVRIDIPRKLYINYGLNRVRYPAPVHTGKRVRGRVKLLSVEEVAPDTYQVVQEITAEIEDEPKPGMVAELVTRLYL